MVRFCRNVTKHLHQYCELILLRNTPLNDDVGQATAAAEATKLFVEGKDVEKYYWVDYVKVTKDNASQYLKED